MDELNIIQTDKTNICFIGDLHGEFKCIPGLMKHTGLTDAVYIFAGDCGFGFESETHYSNIFNRIGKTAKKFNSECIFIRGNHDDKEYYSTSKINRKYFRSVPDYTVLQSPTHNILCVGGAISIDRTYRLAIQTQNETKYRIYHRCSIEAAKLLTPKVYWPTEPPVFNESALNKITASGIKIDIVCTHTCPSFAQPITKDGIKSWMGIDPLLDVDTKAERQVMDDIYNKLIKDGHPLSKWFYGHYHYHNTEVINNIQFIMLDMFRNGMGDCYPLYE